MPAHFTADTFRWHCRPGSLWTFQLPGVEPVHFAGDRIRTRNWLDTKHADGAMHEAQFSFTLARLIEILDPSTYFDIGGYIGYFTILPMAWLRRDARIFCFEVNRRFCLLTRHSVDLNTHLSTSRVFVQNAGVGAEVDLARPVHIEAFTVSDPDPVHEANAHVDMLSLDHIHGPLRIAPDLVKMDIEGFEGPAIRGGRSMLGEARPTILFELHSDEFLAPHQSDRRSVIEELVGLDYAVFAVEGTRHSSVRDRPLYPIDDSNLDSVVAETNTGVVATPAERRSELVELVRPG